MVILSMFQQPESPIIYEQTSVRALLDSRDLGTGSLIISERTLCWKEQGGLGFSIEYPHVSMHAITKDPAVYSTECVLVIIDEHVDISGIDMPSIQNPVEDEENSDSESDKTSQLILVPLDSNSIQTIYTALNQCQLLNPDPQDVMDDDEEENVYEDAEEYNEDEFVSAGRLNDLGAGGDSDINHLSSQLRNHSIHTNYSYGNGDQNFDDDQFEDAD